MDEVAREVAEAALAPSPVRASQTQAPKPANTKQSQGGKGRPRPKNSGPTRFSRLRVCSWNTGGLGVAKNGVVQKHMEIVEFLQEEREKGDPVHVMGVLETHLYGREPPIEITGYVCIHRNRHGKPQGYTHHGGVAVYVAQEGAGKEGKGEGGRQGESKVKAHPPLSLL